MAIFNYLIIPVFTYFCCYKYEKIAIDECKSFNPITHNYKIGLNFTGGEAGSTRPGFLAVEAGWYIREGWNFIR